MEGQRSAYKQIIRTHLRSAYLLSEDRIDVLLPQYLASLRDLVLTLEQKARTASPGEASRAAHALKGALLSLGLGAPAEKAYSVEQKCTSADQETECAKLIAELKREITGID